MSEHQADNSTPIHDDGKPDVIADDALASAVWDFYRVKLEDADKWRPEYAATFAVFARAVADWVRTTQKLNHPDQQPLLVNPNKGTTYRNPLVDLQAQYANTIDRYGKAFGLNPLADARIKTGDGQGVLFDFSSLMRGPRVET